MQIRRISVLIIGPLLAALVACTPAKSPAVPQSPSPSAAGPSLSARSAAEMRALVAYTRMWQAFERAATVPDPRDPMLARYADGRALELVTKALESFVADRLRARGTTWLNPRATLAQPADMPTEVRVEDCMDTSGTRLFKVDGSRYGDTPGGRRRMIATVRLVGSDTWKVTSFGLGEVGSC
jgi:hypothetical protein